MTDVTAALTSSWSSMSHLRSMNNLNASGKWNQDCASNYAAEWVLCSAGVTVGSGGDMKFVLAGGAVIWLLLGDDVFTVWLLLRGDVDVMVMGLVVGFTAVVMMSCHLTVIGWWCIWSLTATVRRWWWWWWDWSLVDEFAVVSGMAYCVHKSNYTNTQHRSVKS